MNEPLLQQRLERAWLREQLPSPEMCRSIREQAGLTQQDVADVLGVHRVTVARWEAGVRHPADGLIDDYLLLLGELADKQERDQP